MLGLLFVESVNCDVKKYGGRLCDCCLPHRDERVLECAVSDCAEFCNQHWLIFPIGYSQIRPTRSTFKNRPDDCVVFIASYLSQLNNNIFIIIMFLFFR